MEDLRFAVVGIGAAGTVVAAALLIIIEGCFKEALDVAKAMCYDIGQQNAHVDRFFRGVRSLSMGGKRAYRPPFM
jgi:hypothetical protein